MTIVTSHPIHSSCFSHYDYTHSVPLVSNLMLNVFFLFRFLHLLFLMVYLAFFFSLPSHTPYSPRSRHPSISSLIPTFIPSPIPTLIRTLSQPFILTLILSIIPTLIPTLIPSLIPSLILIRNPCLSPPLILPKRIGISTE